MAVERLYEITVYTENQVGLLSSIAGIFTRRSMNIEKLFVYPSRIEGVHKFRIQTRTTEDRARSVVLHIEKKVDVIKAYYYVDEEYSAREEKAVREFLRQRQQDGEGIS